MIVSALFIAGPARLIVHQQCVCVCWSRTGETTLKLCSSLVFSQEAIFIIDANVAEVF